ncbi:hypothetical protein LTR53_008262 [Teratosphaeriaceae sp. CCFEE 6253]|nr:hypothetical protein LTR53_008262 [Teratosphaeriaceae sp. CCFEE 6253]
MTMHPDIAAGKTLLEQNDLATLLGRAVTRKPGSNEAACDRLQCGSLDGQPCWVFLRMGGHGKGFAVQFERDEPVSTSKPKVTTEGAEGQRATTPSKGTQSRNMTVKFAKAGVTSDCRFPRYLDPELWNPSSADPVYKKFGITLTESEQEWRSFLVKVYQAACPEEAAKLALDPEERQRKRRKLSDGSLSGPRDEAFQETEPDQVQTEVVDSDQVREDFVKLYLSLSHPDQIWNAYNLDLDDPRLDLSLEVVCQRLAIAWCELNLGGTTVGPEAKLLRDALEQKRTLHLDNCESSDVFSMWTAVARSGPRTATLFTKYKFVSPTEQFAAKQEEDRVAASNEAARRPREQGFRWVNPSTLFTSPAMKGALALAQEDLVNSGFVLRPLALFHIPFEQYKREGVPRLGGR